jgi:hypothetical protein
MSLAADDVIGLGGGIWKRSGHLEISHLWTMEMS